MILEEQITRRLGKTHIDYRFHIYDSLLSSNDLAKEMIKSDDNCAGTVIIANTQTAGRGRKSRTFSSPKGGLYISIVFSGEQLINKQQYVLFAPGVAVCITLEKLLGIKPQIKWPNDILLEDKKICGILTEILKCADDEHIIIGIGVNYSTRQDLFPKEIQSTAGSLEKYIGKLTINEFIAVLIKTMDSINASFSTERYIAEYKERMGILGKDIVVLENEKRINATAIDLCDDGGLVIRKNEGVEKIYAGDVSIRKAVKF